MNANDEITCIKCNKTFSWVDAYYCPYCGFNLFNSCTNPECEMCPSNLNFEDGWALKWNYKFCPECGSKSIFHDFIDETDLPQNGQ